ncbi:hypothetical protein SAMN04487895_102242 [Paenibacillus sophorae]|uniref:Transposase InsH N-terminal domain-containing protein n=1 Tax=Paenibacillus sophorae TaxID=1333845 RepID=A0A1H8IM06_9BACL|nr:MULTISPECIES: hypothetical protein [Paenibacillus]SEN69382.1 hypothetical protein SAMN04487895_102242 [Paenibacillus sophorae]
MYIHDSMDQLHLPMDLEEDFPPNHFVRVVNDMVNRTCDKIFAAAHPGAGRHSYHPKMLTKIILYAYISGSTLPVKSPRLCGKPSRSCGWPDASTRTSAPLTGSAASG